MFKKLLITGLLLTFTSIANATPISQNTIQNPEEFVKQFYQWYIKKDKGSDPAEMTKDIYKFVSKSTVDKIQLDTKNGTLPNDVSYFTKVQDYDPTEWQSSINVHAFTELNNGVVLVPVSLGKTEKSDVILFLDKNKGHWEIIKAVDSRPF